MAVPQQVEEGAKKAQEIWNQQYSQQTETPPDGEQGAVPPAATAEDQSQQAHRIDPEDYKSRYASYKAKTDNTIHDLRTQLAAEAQRSDQLSAQLDELGKRLQSAPTQDAGDDWKSTLSEDELELLGPEIMAVVAKVAGVTKAREIKDMQSRIANMEKSQQQTREVERQRQQESIKQDFTQRLMEAVPDVNQIDANPDFRRWLDGIDGLSGVQRRKLATHAMKSFDVGRVAHIYNEWKAENANQTNPREGRMTPPRAADAAPQPQGKIWTSSEVTAFYAAKRRGEISGDEAKLVEQDIFAAQREGRYRR